MSSVHSVDVKNIAPELGVYFIVLLVIYILFISKIQGRIEFIEVYIASRNWNFLESLENLEKNIGILKFIMISTLMTPVFCLLVWVGTLIFIEAQSSLKYDTDLGISTFFICAGFILIITGVGNMKWEKYRMTRNTILLILFGTLSYTTYLFVAVFMQYQLDFIGLSAIFISANAILVFIVILFTHNNGATTVDQVLEKLSTLNELSSEIKELYTIPQVQDDHISSAVSGGIQVLFTKTHYSSKRKLFIFITYLTALGTLAAYSAVSNLFSVYPSLGILNTALILAIDLLVFLFTYAKILKSSISSVFLSLVARLFIFLLSEENWFYGYSCVYWTFSLYSINHIINLHFPLEHKIAHIHSVSRNDIGRTVEFTYFSSIAVYVCLIIAVVLGKPKGIPYTTLQVEEYQIPLWLIGICVVMISLIFGVFVICIRLTIRKIHKIPDNTEYYLFCKGFGMLWIVGLVGALLCWISAIAIYLSVTSHVLVTMLIIMPLIILINLNLYANWAKNDYSVVKNPKDFNKHIKRKRKEEEDIIEQVRNYQEEYIEKILQLNGNENTENEIRESEFFLNATGSRLSLNPKTALKNKLGMIDPEKLRENLPELMYDWTEEMNVIKAFFKGKLSISDYLNIIGVYVSILMSCAMAGIVYAFDRQMTYGVTAAVMILCLKCVVYPLQHNLYTAIPLSNYSYLLISFALFLNFSYGYIFYHFQLHQNSSSIKSGITVFFNTFALPIIISYYYALRKLRAENWKVSKYSIVMLSFAQVFSFSGAAVIIVIDKTAGISLFGFFFIISLYLSIFMKYSYQNFRFPKWLNITITVFSVSIIASGIIIGTILDRLGIYAGASITFLFTCLIFIIYSILMIHKNLKNASTAPVFFSAWIFPIYKYNPAESSIEKANNMGIQLFLGLSLVFLWSISCVIWVSPTYIGVSIACFSEVLIILTYVFLSIITSSQLDDALKLLNTDENQKVLKKAWNESKQKFLEKMGAAGYEDFPSYYERSQKLTQLFKMIKNKDFNIPENNNAAWKRRHTDLKNIRDLLVEYYIEEKRNNFQYIFELELAIHFNLLIVLSAFSLKTAEILLHNNLALNKAVELKAFGIVFTDNNLGKTIVEKYSFITKEISKLDPIQFVRFNEIKEQYIIELERQKIQRKIQENEEARAAQVRLLTMKTIYKKRKEKLKNQTANLAIDEMVDSIDKYYKILKICQIKNKKFEDSQFPPSEAALGSTAVNTIGWKRAENCSLFGDSLSPLDVKQGAIGDCYFLSAISVLKEEDIKKNFIDYSIEFGVYLLMFFKNGDPVYVIIDDYFPVNPENEWAFARTVSGKELWPMLLEKAYAKLNGGYENIVAGKVHFALSDITGGQPEEIKLDSVQNNPDSLWSKLLRYKKNDYPMGSGTPEVKKSCFVSRSGIVQGHAYSILDTQEVNGDKVIKLRNPHGQHRQEWNGDWSEGSGKWTKLAKIKLRYSEKANGVFWMSLEDFVWEFKNLYICRIFNDPKWKKLEIKGNWKGVSAAGFPCKENPQAVIKDNPQYRLRVSKNSLAFISLTQKNKVDMFKGKSPIMFLVFSGGKKVTDISKGLVGGSGKPTDLKTVSSEFSFKRNRYTILVTSMYKGELGEGKYELKVTIDDKQAEIIEII